MIIPRTVISTPVFWVSGDCNWMARAVAGRLALLYQPKKLFNPEISMNAPMKKGIASMITRSHENPSSLSRSIVSPSSSWRCEPSFCNRSSTCWYFRIDWIRSLAFRMEAWRSSESRVWRNPPISFCSRSISLFSVSTRSLACLRRVCCIRTSRAGPAN